VNKIQKVIAWFLIPKGYYCHNSGNHNKVCPFWFMDKTKPIQMNGYCSYLGKGDWDFYKEMPNKIEVSQRQSDGSYRKVKIKKEPMFCETIIWDKVKACNKR
jgi:hypothetical protein